MYKASLLATLIFSTFSAANAQSSRPNVFSFPAAIDSVTKLYTYIQYMPLYRGKEGTQKLTEDLTREFQAACVTSGCASPTFPLFVSLTIGPSGFIYDAKRINVKRVDNLAVSDVGAKGNSGTQPNPEAMPAACEAALLAAAHKLPRLTPGALNGRRVAVSYILKLVGTTK